MERGSVWGWFVCLTPLPAYPPLPGCSSLGPYQLGPLCATCRDSGVRQDAVGACVNSLDNRPEQLPQLLELLHLRRGEQDSCRLLVLGLLKR